jgi:hypothetical protein
VFAVTEGDEARAARDLQRRFLDFFGATFWSTVCRLNPAAGHTYFQAD